jgi:hypothetical protein
MRQRTIELVGFPSIFISTEALLSFTRGMESDGSSTIGRGESGIEKGAKSVIARSLADDPRECGVLIEHLQAWDAGLEGRKIAFLAE